MLDEPLALYIMLIVVRRNYIGTLLLACVKLAVQRPDSGQFSLFNDTQLSSLLALQYCSTCSVPLASNWRAI